MKIIVKGPNWIGDTIMMTPALTILKKICIDAHITVHVNKSCADVLKANPYVDDIMIGREKENWGAFLSAAQEIRKEKFDVGILMPNSFSSALLLYLGNVKHRIGYNRDGRGMLLTEKIKLTPERLKMHQVEYYLEVLSPLQNIPPHAKWESDISEEDKKLVYVVTDEEREKLQDYLRKKVVSETHIIAVINPGGYFGPSKRWFTDRYAKVADFLALKYDARIFITGSPKESALFDEIQKQCNFPLIDATKDMDIRLLGAFLEKCKLMITNDSGPMHIAAAMNCPIISIFGPTDPNATSPRSKKAIVLSKKVDCSPCFLKICPIDHKCMTQIEIDEVTKNISLILDKQIFEKENNINNDKKAK